MKIYQYSNGTYLPISSQPSNTEDYEIKERQYMPHKSTRYINVHLGTNGKAMRVDKTVWVECEKILPELYEKKMYCCGCTACFSICPVDAIRMLPDEEGFLYPVVDAQQCIRCYKCMSVCAYRNDYTMKST